MKIQNLFIGVILFLFFTVSENISGQNYSSWGKLKSGTYKVGFRTIETYDSSRTYKPEEGIKYRPLLIHLWYPTISKSQNWMTYKSYVALETRRENFTNNNADEYCRQIMDGYIKYGKNLMGNLELTNEEVLSSATAALHNAKLTKGKFPLIIYAPSHGKSSIQNNIACEYFASHGYIIASVASAGENSQAMESDEKGVLAQVMDMEYVVDYIINTEKNQVTKIGTFGFSWGSISNIIFQMRNQYVKAIALWDGSIEYHGYKIAQTMTDFKPEKMKVPYIFFSNKHKDWTEFPFYKSVKSDKKYLYRLKQLEHSEFTSFWTVFANTKENASSYNVESYKNLCEQTLLFFDIYLKDKKSMKKDLQNFNAKIMTKLNVEKKVL